MPDNPYNLTHSVIQDSDGRYEIRLYRGGCVVVGASNFRDAQEGIDEVYAVYLEKHPLRKFV